MRRGSKLVAWAAALIVLLIVLGLAWLLAFEAGGRWALKRIPGVEVEGFNGRLAGYWQAEQLTWQQEGTRAVLAQPQLSWRPACLTRLALCLDRLSVASLELQVSPSDRNGPQEPLQLPDLKLPLGVEIGELAINDFAYNGTRLFESLRLRGRWVQSGIVVESLTVKQGAFEATAAGALDPRGEWPLSVSAAARLPPRDGQPWSLRLIAEGELQRAIDLQLASEGYLDALLTGEIRPLQEHIPATLQLQIERFRPGPQLPEPLTLERVALTLAGDRQAGYRIEGQARLPGTDGAVDMLVEALLHEQAIQFNRLVLEADPSRRLAIDGQLSWAPVVSADLKVNWQDFPWYWLYPREPLPVSLSKLTGQLQYEDGSFLGHFDARLHGPAGDFSVVSPFSGNQENLYLPQLELIAGQGRAAGTLGLSLGDALGWSADLTLTDLDPAYWFEPLRGSLGGSLRSEGRAADGDLRLTAELDLSGRLREQSTRLQGRGQLDERGTLQVSGLDLRIGDNQLQGEGVWGERADGALRLELGRLSQLWPDLSGQARGQLTLAGTASAPVVSVQLDGQRLRFQEQRLANVSLRGSLSAAQAVELTLQAEGLQSGDADWGQLRIEVAGSEARHTASVALAGPRLASDLVFAGGLEQGQWSGQLNSGQITALDQRWTLQSPTSLRRDAEGGVTLGAHCWRDAPASLCAEQQRLFPRPQIAYALRDLSIERFSGLFPEGFAWQGLLQADLAVELTEAGPRGRVSAEAAPGVLRAREGENWLQFPYSAMRVQAELQPDTVTLESRFDGGDLGDFRLSARVDPAGDAWPLSGTFRLQGFNLSVLTPLIPDVDQLHGVISGEGELGGSLLQPSIHAELALTDGLVAGERLPTRLEDLTLSVLVRDHTATLEGGWVSGRRGKGRLAGAINWDEALRIDVHIAGENLPISVEPYAELEASPSLDLRLQDQRLVISGRIDVPRGEIHIRELPPSTVRVSPDAVIVGEEEARQQTPMQVSMDIDVEVGRERLRFTGFGLTADLAGHLHIGDNLDTRGELVLKNGRYRAYGQRLALRRARLLFTGTVTEPFLDIEAIRRIEHEDVTAGLRITGSTSNPVIEVFSEPAMSQEQALSYLLLGRAPGADAGDNNLIAQAALGLGLARTTGITGAVADRLGIQDFQLEAEGSGAETAVVASGRLSERLSLRYGVGVFTPGNTLALRYQLTRRIFLEAASGLANSLDIFYRRDF